MSITVEDALKIGDMARCKLIAGSGGLGRSVSYIDTMEIPNIQPWLKKNLLLITTGYAIKDDVQALPRLILDLEKIGAAGIAIKTRFLGDIPEETIRLANRLNLPLIEIPKEIPFVEITMPLMKAIIGEHHRNLEFSERMNQKFLELELDKGSFDSIADALANLINLPVVVVSRTHTVLASSSGKDCSVPDSVLVTASDQTLKLSECISSRIAGLVSTAVLHHLEIDGCPPLIVRSVVIKKQVCGYICVICRRHELDDLQLIVLNHAATSVALEISKMQKLEEHMRFMQNSLFLDLLAGNIKTKNEAESRAKLLHWPTPPVRIVVLDIDRFGTAIQNTSEENIQSLKENLHQLIISQLRPRFHSCTVMLYSNNFVILLPESISVETLTALFNNLVELIKNRLHLPVTIGISDSCNSYSNIAFYYEEGCDAISIGRVPNAGGPVQLISNIRLEQALLKSCSNVYFRRYVDDTIGKLEQYDRQQGSDLTKTLDVLLENMGARQATAEKLFIHRNTLANRLSKIEKITGLNLAKNENLYRLGFALKIRYYLSDERA